MRAGEGDGGAGAVAGGDDAVWNGGRESAEDQIHHTLAGAEPAVDRGGMHAVDDGAGGRGDMERPGEAGVRQDGRIDQ